MKGLSLQRPLRALALLSLPLLSPSVRAEDAVLPEVVVESTSLQAQRQAAPNPVFVIGRDEIDATNDLTLGDFLRRQPGITFTGPPGDPKDVRLMGMDKGYTQILINGQAVPGGGKERQIQVDQMPMTMVERVEIIRSPLPDQPGDGIAGAINIVLRERVDDELLVRLSAGVIRSDSETSPNGNVQLTWSRRGAAADVVLPLSVIRRHELKTKPKVTEKFSAGTRTTLTEEFENENNEVAEISLAPRLTWRPTAADTLVLSLFGNRNEGDKDKTREVWTSLTPAAGGNFVPSGSEFENELKDRHTVRAGAEWKHRFSAAWESGLQLQWQQAGEDKDKRKDSLNPLGAVTATETEVARMRHDSLAAGARISWRGVPAHVLAAGIDVADEARDDDKRKVKNGVPEAPGRGDSFRVDEQKQVLWLRDDWTLGRNQLLVSGLRWQWLARESQDGAGERSSGRARVEAAPSLSYRWQATPQLTVRAALAQTFRPPRFDDLSAVVQSASGTNSATNPDVAGNPALAPEEALGVDVGADWFSAGRQLQLGINASQRRIENLIQKETRFEADSGRHVERPYNLPGTSLVETLAVDGRLQLAAIGLTGVVLSGNYSRFDSEAYDPATGRRSGRVKDQPPYAWNAGLDWGLPRTDAVLGARYNYLPETEKENGDIESAQELLDVFLSWNLSPRHVLRLNATNLLDTSKFKDKPRYSGSDLVERTRELEQGGRKFLVSLDLRF